MNYRITSDFNAPFKLYSFFQTVSQYKVEMTIKLKATFPKSITASSVHVRFSVPKSASGVTPDVISNQGNQKSEYN
jgi:AP-4 complex subunit mu-1